MSRWHWSHAGHHFFRQPSERLARYNILDCIAPSLAAPVMLAEAAELDMLTYWNNDLWPMVEPVIDMQQRGLYVNKAAMKELKSQLRAELRAVDKDILACDPTGKLAKPTPKARNGLNSPARLARFLHTELGLKSHKRNTSGRGPSTDQEALLKIYDNLLRREAHHRPLLENLIHRSRIVTILTRYLTFDTDADGRVRPRVKMLGTKTGRFAYENPPAQQFPPEIRYIFEARPGHVLVSADYSQLEARILAILAAIQTDTSVFLDPNLDIHDETTKAIFDFTSAEWAGMPKDQRVAARNYGKSFRYRVAYGGDPDSVGALGSKVFCPCPRPACRENSPPALNLPAVKITMASRKFLNDRPEIEAFRRTLETQVSTYGYYQSPLGRKRIFHGTVKDFKRELYNCPMQTIAIEIINRAMVAGWQRWRAPYWIQYHDSLTVEVPEADASLWSDRLTEVMAAPIPELGGAIFPVDIDIYKQWGVK